MAGVGQAVKVRNASTIGSHRLVVSTPAVDFLDRSVCPDARYPKHFRDSCRRRPLWFWTGRRPRVQTADDKEVRLGSYELFHRGEPLTETVWEKLMLGLTTRKYGEAVREFTEAYGLEKSAVSEHFIAASRAKLKDMMERRLDKMRLCALLIDATPFEGQQMVAALGIGEDGRKTILGIRQGATENATVVGELLGDLVERGLDFITPRLYVLDGGKALATAVKKYAGESAAIQRCQVHRRRNVLDHLRAYFLVPVSAPPAPGPACGFSGLHSARQSNRRQQTDSPHPRLHQNANDPGSAYRRRHRTHPRPHRRNLGGRGCLHGGPARLLRNPWRTIRCLTDHMQIQRPLRERSGATKEIHGSRPYARKRPVKSRTSDRRRYRQSRAFHPGTAAPEWPHSPRARR